MKITELLPLKVYPFTLMCIGALPCFSAIYNFCDVVFISPGIMNPEIYEIRSTLEATGANSSKVYSHLEGK